MRIGSSGLKTQYECQVCGRYDASSSVLEDQLDTQDERLTSMQRAILSHRIREANDARGVTPVLTTYEVEDVIAHGRLTQPAAPASQQHAAALLAYDFPQLPHHIQYRHGEALPS